MLYLLCFSLVVLDHIILLMEEILHHLGWVRASSVHAVRGLICTRGQGPRLYTRNGFSVCTPLFLQLCLLNTGYTTGLDMCKVCTAAVHSVALWTRVTLQVWTCVSMYRSSPFRSTFNTGCITGVDTCNIRTEAVHSVALWTRLTLQVWTCVSMYRSSPFRSTLNIGLVCVQGEASHPPRLSHHMVHSSSHRPTHSPYPPPAV